MNKLLIISICWLVVVESSAQSIPTKETAPSVVWHVPQTDLAPGDTLFYKLHLVSPVSYALDPTIKTVRVQLVDTTQKRSMITHYLRVKRGLAYGRIILPDSLSTTHYVLVASTLLDNKHFSQAITVREKQGSQNLLSHTVSRRPPSRLSVHAEGGHLVQGLQTKLLMLTVDESGKPTGGQGHIQDQSGETVTTFSTDSVGQGSCYLTPQAGGRYTAVINSTNQPTPLPSVLASGYAFSVDYTGSADSIFLYIDQSVDLRPDTVTITGTLRGKQWYQARIPMTQANAFVGLSKSVVPATGLLSFKLTDSKDQLVGERVLFHQAKPALLLSIMPDKPSYAPGEKITLSFSVTDSLNHPTLANMSLAVTESTASLGSGKTVETSEIMEAIMNPDWLLRHTIENFTASQLQRINEWLIGYRAGFSTALQPTTKPSRLNSKDGLLRIRGIVRTPFGKGAANASVTLLCQSLPKPLHRTRTDGNGTFEFDDLDFEGSVTVVLSAKDDKQTVLTDIALMDEEALSAHKPVGASLVESPVMKSETSTYSLDSTNSKQLDEVMVKAKKSSPLAGDSRRTLYGEPDIEILFDEKTVGYTSIRESMAGRVPGMTISDSAFMIRGFDNRSRMMIMLDGIPSDYQSIMSVAPFYVRAIDVIKDPGKMGIFGVRGGSGVINVLTKRGEFAKNSGRKDVVTRTIRGYEPVSEGPVIQNEGHLTYWNPSIDIQHKAQQTVSFLAPSHPTVCKVRALVTNGLGTFIEKQFTLLISPR